MAQNTVDFSIDPSGDQLLDELLTNLQENFLTTNSGSSRPSYVEIGTQWLDTTTTPWVWKIFNGTDDIVIGSVNPSTLVFTPSALPEGTALSVNGRASNTDGPNASIVAASDGQVMRRAGNSIGFGQILAAGVADNTLTNAKLAQVATTTIKGRATAGTGNVEDLTLSQVLDMIGSAARGDILYRGASSWQRLPKGTEGQILRMGADDPAWGSVASTTTVDITTSTPIASFVTGFSGDGLYRFEVRNAKPVTDAVYPYLRVSVNGSTLADGASDYEWSHEENGAVGSSGGASQIQLTRDNCGNVANESGDAVIDVTLRGNTVVFSGLYRRRNSVGLPRSAFFAGKFIGSGTPTGIGFQFSSGNIDVGNFKLTKVRAD